MSYEESLAVCDECYEPICDDDPISCAECYASLERELDAAKDELRSAEDMITDLEVALTEANAELERLTDEIVKREKD